MPSSTLDGHGHSGNEDLDHAIALSLSGEEQRKENNIGAVFKWTTMKNLLELYKQAWTLAPLCIHIKVLSILRCMVIL